MATTITIPTYALSSTIPSQYTEELQIMVHFPPSLAQSISTDLDQTNGADITITFTSNRQAKLIYEGNVYHALLLDLPTHVETLKQMPQDSDTYVKIADIGQKLIVFDDEEHFKREMNSRESSKNWSLTEGLTWQTTYLTKRRIIKEHALGTRKDVEEAEEIVQRLLEKDEKAKKSLFTLQDSRGRVIIQNDPETGKFIRGHGHGEMMDLDESISQQPTLDDNITLEGVTEEVTEENMDDDMEEDIDGENEEESALSDLAEEIEENMQIEVPALSQEEQINPIINQLRERIEEKRIQLNKITNPMIKARLEDVIRQLENELKIHSKP